MTSVTVSPKFQVVIPTEEKTRSRLIATESTEEHEKIKSINL